MACLTGLAALSPCLAEDVAHREGMVTHSSPTEKYPYVLPGYYASNNAWGMKDRTNGVDYSTSVTLDPAHFESGTSFSWKYPQNIGRVFGYPHIGYDPRAAGVNSTQSADFANISASFTVRLSNPTDSTVAFDIWFNNQPNGPWETTSVELLVEAHPTSRPSVKGEMLARLRHLFRSAPPQSSLVLTSAGLAGAPVRISHPSQSGASWSFIDVKLPEDVMSGSVSLSNIIKELIWDGVMTGDEYLTTLQFGSEVLGGEGGLQIDKLSYDLSAKARSPGAGGKDAPSISRAGANRVVGSGAGDTVSYEGAYESYRIKSDGAKSLVIKNDDVSTLDRLEGISFIKFSNGTYNATTGKFSASSAGSR